MAWPTINDSPRKDANDVLVNDSADVLREVSEAAEPYPIRGLHPPEKYRAGVLAEALD